jgi:hypothetical protein
MAAILPDPTGDIASQNYRLRAAIPLGSKQESVSLVTELHRSKFNIIKCN